MSSQTNRNKNHLEDLALAEGDTKTLLHGEEPASDVEEGSPRRPLSPPPPSSPYAKPAAYGDVVVSSTLLESPSPVLPTVIDGQEGLPTVNFPASLEALAQPHTRIKVRASRSEAAFAPGLLEARAEQVHSLEERAEQVHSLEEVAELERTSEEVPRAVGLPAGLPWESKVTPTVTSQLRQAQSKQDADSSPSAEAAKAEAWVRVPRPSQAQGSELLRWHSEVDKRYTWLSRLGEGGAGEVMLVNDNLIERQVAMKRLRDDASPLSGNQRFVEEVRIIGRLEHPNIVPLYDAGVDREDNAFFTMKYVEGETLESVIEKLRAGDPAAHEAYPIERRVRIFLEILRAVHFAHTHGVLHRDLKPSNVMLGAFGEVMVMDWGSAQRIDPKGERVPTTQSPRAFQTRDGALVGTPAYMSPEQALGKRDELDERSDIYSLCVLFYEFLCLRHYLEHKQSIQEILFAIVSEAPAPADSVWMPVQGKIPRNLWFMIQKGMAKDPSLRFQSVPELIKVLEQYLEGHIGIHCPSTLVKRVALSYAHFLDSYRATGVLLALLFVLLAGVGVFQLGAWLGKL